MTRSELRELWEIRCHYADDPEGLKKAMIESGFIKPEKPKRGISWTKLILFLFPVFFVLRLVWLYFFGAD